FGTGLREAGVLRQEAVAGMHGVASGVLGSGDDAGDAEIGGSATALQGHGFVDAADMQRIRVVFGIYADSGDAKLRGGLGDADGDLAAVGDQELAWHVLEIFMGKRLLIVAHAPSENTLSLRAAVERGALSETEIDVHVVAPLQAGPDDVLTAQAVILGTTENL